MKVTKETLIDKLNNGYLNTWSQWHLASIAIAYYAGIEDTSELTTEKELQLLNELGFSWTGDIIKKYHSEVGYSDWDLHEDYCNCR